jgi:hypothetical protein
LKIGGHESSGKTTGSGGAPEKSTASGCYSFLFCYSPFLSFGAGRNPMVRAAGIVIGLCVRGL